MRKMIACCGRTMGLVAGSLALLATVSGCESTQTQAAHKISDALPKLIGPARHYEVSVHSSAFSLARGHADSVHIYGQDVQVARDTTLDTLDVTAQGVSFDTQAHRISGAQSIAFTGTVGQSNLTRYVQAHDQSLPGLAVEMHRSNVVARLPITALGIHTSAAVTGTLAPDPKRLACIDFVADRAHLGILPVPAALVNSALRLTGPVFDLSAVPFPLVITQVSIVNGTLVLQGTARLKAGPTQ